MEPQELEKILEKHRKWVCSRGGERADLRGADLWGADLEGANLEGAKNLKMYSRSDLNILSFQKGKLRAFKYLNGDISPYKYFKYLVGWTYSVKKEDCDTNVSNGCGAGLNVASLEWCLRDTKFDLTKTYIEVEFNVKDIVCIPFVSNGKFRVKKLKVIRKVPVNEIKKLYADSSSGVKP